MVIDSASLTAINEAAPYKVKCVDSEKCTLCFSTDYDVEIFVTFEEDDLFSTGLAYQFGISNPKGIPSPRDPKVRDTILAIVEEFFCANEAALLYICETGDGMQRMRSRLFRFWFGIYGGREEYVFLPQTVADEEGNENYAVLIIHKDNPHFADMVAEFMETIMLLNAKPGDEELL